MPKKKLPSNDFVVGGCRRKGNFFVYISHYILKKVRGRKKETKRKTRILYQVELISFYFYGYYLVNYMKLLNKKLPQSGFFVIKKINYKKNNE